MRDGYSVEAGRKDAVGCICGFPLSGQCGEHLHFADSQHFLLPRALQVCNSKELRGRLHLWTCTLQRQHSLPDFLSRFNFKELIPRRPSEANAKSISEIVKKVSKVLDTERQKAVQNAINQCIDSWTFEYSLLSSLIWNCEGIHQIRLCKHFVEQKWKLDGLKTSVESCSSMVVKSPSHMSQIEIFQEHIRIITKAYSVLENSVINVKLEINNYISAIERERQENLQHYVYECETLEKVKLVYERGEMIRVRILFEKIETTGKEYIVRKGTESAKREAHFSSKIKYFNETIETVLGEIQQIVTNLRKIEGESESIFVQLQTEVNQYRERSRNLTEMIGCYLESLKLKFESRYADSWRAIEQSWNIAEVHNFREKVAFREVTSELALHTGRFEAVFAQEQNLPTRGAAELFEEHRACLLFHCGKYKECRAMCKQVLEKGIGRGREVYWVALFYFAHAVSNPNEAQAFIHNELLTESAQFLKFSIEGRLAFLRVDYQEAEKCTAKAEQLSCKLHSVPVKRAMNLCILAKASYKLKQYKWRNCRSSAEELLRTRCPCSMLRVDILTWWADRFIDCGQRELAIKFRQTALELLTTFFPTSPDFIENLDSLAHLLTLMKSLKLSEKMRLKAHRHLQNNFPSSDNYISNIHSLCEYYNSVGKGQKGIELRLESHRLLLRTHPTSKNFIINLDELSYMYWMDNQPTKIVAMWLDVRSFLQAHHPASFNYAQSVISLGMHSLDWKEKAADFSLEAEQFCQRYRSLDAGCVDVLLSLARLCDALGQFEKSVLFGLEAYNISQALYPKAGNFSSVVNFVSNLYTDIEQTSKAIAFRRDVRRFLNESDPTSHCCVDNLMKLAKLYLINDEKERAIEEVLEAHRHLDCVNPFSIEYAEILAELADLYKDIDESRKEIELRLEAHQLLQLHYPTSHHFKENLTTISQYMFKRDEAKTTEILKNACAFLQKECPASLNYAKCLVLLDMFTSRSQSWDEEYVKIVPEVENILLEAFNILKQYDPKHWLSESPYMSNNEPRCDRDISDEIFTYLKKHLPTSIMHAETLATPRKLFVSKEELKKAVESVEQSLNFLEKSEYIHYRYICRSSEDSDADSWNEETLVEMRLKLNKILKSHFRTSETYSTSQLRLVSFYLKKREVAQAEKVLLKCLASLELYRPASDLLESALQLLEGLYRAAQIEKAIEVRVRTNVCYQHALPNSRECVHNLQCLGKLYRDSGNKVLAIETYFQSLPLYQNLDFVPSGYFSTVDTLQDLLLEMHEDTKALEMLRESYHFLRTRHPENSTTAEVMYLLRDMLVEMNKLDEAEDVYKQIILIPKWRSGSIIELSEFYARHNKFEAAFTLLATYAKKEPAQYEILRDFFDASGEGARDFSDEDDISSSSEKDN